MAGGLMDSADVSSAISTFTPASLRRLLPFGFDLRVDDQAMDGVQRAEIRQALMAEFRAVGHDDHFFGRRIIARSVSTSSTLLLKNPRSLIPATLRIVLRTLRPASISLA